MTYEYYVVYSYDCGKGCLLFTTNGKLDCWDCIEQLMEVIKKEQHLNDVIIDNFILLKKYKEQK